METNEKEEVRYNLTSENFNTLQQLVMQTASVFKRTQGLTRSRALLQAEDFVAARRVVGSVSGSELSSWLARQRNARRYHPKAQPTTGFMNKPVPQPIQEIQMQPDIDTFNIKLTGHNFVVDPVLAGMIENCRQIKVGEVWSFPVGSEQEARALADRLPLVSKALGWRTGAKNKTYLFQIFPDRLKLKRTR